MTSRIGSPDTAADLELQAVLDRDVLTGFTVIAGAGSGKTTSLVKALSHVVESRGPQLAARTQMIACVTYTEVAAEEIHGDVEDSPLVWVSTIHSFLWSLAKPFQKDIASWVATRVDEKLAKLEEDARNFSPRVREATRQKNAADTAKLRRQAVSLGSVKRFTYGIGSDYERGVLGHEDVLQLVPQLMLKSPLMARIVAAKFPFIFVDESQDAFAEVVAGLKHVAQESKGSVCLGFFGDPMQQIYQRGVGEVELEEGWVRIQKPENFRSSKQVLSVVNAARSRGDSLVQVQGRVDEAAELGAAYLFVLPADTQRSENLESVREWLSVHGGAGSWSEAEAKVLMIVHRMAARRLGFGNLFNAFHGTEAGSLSESFDEGSAWPLHHFKNVIEPICSATGTDSVAISILRKHSLLFGSDLVPTSAKEVLHNAKEAVVELRRIGGANGSLGTMLQHAIDSRIIDPDPRLLAYLDPNGDHGDVIVSNEARHVLDAMLPCAYEEYAGYRTYIDMRSPYSTQHGTKGAEFEKVVVVLDDEEGRFNLYSYEKFLGLKELSATDRTNIDEGKDSVLDRTAKLYYVCVSRAVNQLAVVFFVADVDSARSRLSDGDLTKMMRVVTLDDLALLNR